MFICFLGERGIGFMGYWAERCCRVGGGRRAPMATCLSLADCAGSRWSQLVFALLRGAAFCRRSQLVPALVGAMPNCPPDNQHQPRPSHFLPPFFSLTPKGTGSS